MTTATATAAGPMASWRARLGGRSVLPLALLVALNTVDELDRALFGTLGPEIKQAFGLGNAGFTAIVGLVLPVALFASMPIASAADRRNRASLTWRAGCVWAVCSALTGLAPVLGMLVLARLGSSIAVVTNGPVHRSLLADYYPADVRSTVYAAHGMGNPIGTLVGPLLGGGLGALLGWRWAFVIVGVPSLVLALVARRRLVEPVRGSLDERTAAVDDSEAQSVRAAFRLMRSVPTLRRVGLGLALAGITSLGLVPLVTLYFDEVFGLGPGGRGVALALISLGATVGYLGGGVVADRMAARDRVWLLWLPSSTLLIGGVLLVLFAAAPTAWLSVFVGALIGMVTGVFAAPLYTAVSLLAPAAARGKAFGMVNLCLLSGVFFVPVAGAIGDAYGLRVGIGVLSIPMVLSGVVMASAGRTLKGDLEAGAVRRERPRHPLRQAREIRSIGLLSKQTFFVAAAAWGVLLGSVGYFELGFGSPADLSSTGAIALATAAVVGVLAGWLFPWSRVVHTAALAGAASMLYAGSRTYSSAGAAASAAVAVLCVGWLLGAAVQLVRATVPASLVPAAAGWLAWCAVSASIPAAMALQASDSAGVRVGLWWLAVFAAIGAVPGIQLWGQAGVDRDRARAREMAQPRVAADGVSETPLLDVTDVEVSYGIVQVLFGVEFSLRKGEMLALLGTNGAGKSTVLKAVSGFLRPTSGSIRLDGEDITGLLPEEIAALGVLLVPGGRPVFPELTVIENLRMGAFLTHRNSAAFQRATDPIFDLFPRLAERRGSPAGALSGGERQMLAVAQSLYSKPRVLLIDELSLGLAPAVVDELLKTVKEIAAGGTGVVLVEQSVNVALSVAERAVFLEKGEVRFTGPAAGLVDRPDVLRSVFLEGAARKGASS